MAVSHIIMKIFLAGLLLVTTGFVPSEPAFAKKPTSFPPSGFENKPGKEKKEKKEKPTIRGLATLHGSVFGGTIEIYNTNGRRVSRFNPQVHPKAGYFELPMAKGHLKRLKKTNDGTDLSTNGLAFRLVLRDGISQDLPGKRVMLMADVTGFDPATQIIYLNPVTTLIARYRDAKPSLTLAEAEADVRAYLAFPDHLLVGRHVTTGVDFFDRQRLLQEARTHRRGLPGYLKSIVPEIGTGLVNSFAQPLAASPSQDALVCVNTFAFEEGADPNTATPFVQVGSDRYLRGSGANPQIQVVTLLRGDLSLVSNQSFPPINTTGGATLPLIESFIATLDSTNIVIISGGSFLGDAVNAQFVDQMEKSLAAIGAASFSLPDARFPSDDPFSPRTWSIIGIPGLEYGDAYQKGWVDQRFPLQDTVTATNCSEPLMTDNRGNLSGYFTADTSEENFTYTPNEFPTFDTNFPNSDPLSNTMQIAGNQPVIAPPLPSGFTGGYHRVQVDGRTGQVVVNAMIGTHKSGVLDQAGVSQFAWEDGFGQPRQGTVGDTLVLMTSVGQTPIAALPQIPDTDPRLEWSTGTQIYAQDYGASFHILNTLSGSDHYSMAGVGSPDPQLPFTYAVESSVQITPNAPFGRVSGFFKRSRQGYFVPVMGSSAELNTEKSNYNADGSPQAMNILEIAYQPASNWPYADPDPASAHNVALDDIARNLEFSGGEDMRSQYFSPLPAWGGELLNTLHGFVLSDDKDSWPGFDNGDYTQAQWDEVIGELGGNGGKFPGEFGYLDSIHRYLTTVQQFLDNSGATNQANLKGVGDAVEDKVSASGSNNVTHILGDFFTATASVFIAAVAVSNPEIAVALTAVMATNGLAQQLAADAGGNSADAFETKVSDLSSDVQTNTALAVKGIESLRVLLTTDYGKLSESAPLTTEAWGGNQLNSNILATMLEQASTQNYYGTLMEQRWTAYTLEDPKTNLTYTGPGKKRCNDGNDQPWIGVPASARLNLIWGYNKSGKPIQQGWFWGRDYDAARLTGKVPSVSLTDPLWETAGFEDSNKDVGVGLSMPIFWWQQNAARRFKCSSGSIPYDSRTTGKKG